MNDLHPKRLLGKVVVVTGAARGQGAAEAEALAREGARDPGRRGLTAHGGVKSVSDALRGEAP